MTDEFRELDDFELAAEHVLACAEIARAEGELLRDSGFRPVRVVGMPSFLWKRHGTLYTTPAAVEEATATDTKEDRYD